MESKKNFNSPPFAAAAAGRKPLCELLNCDSPMRVLPSISTPPSHITKLKNPFETRLAEKMHMHVMSPTVFTTTQTPQSEKFKWTIDDVSMLKPANIDESSMEQYCHHETDVILDSYVQEKIDKFFESHEIIPSPYSHQQNKLRLLGSNVKQEKVEQKDCQTQTALSLPMVLPEELEKLLKPYFNQEENDSENGAASDGLYKRLFDFEEDDTKSLPSSPEKLLSLSSLNGSPVVKYANDNNCLHFSPLSINSDEISCRIKSSIQLNFSNRIPHSTTEPQNVLRDVVETLSMFTDTKTDIVSPKKLDNFEAEISNSDTPRSKIFSSQRKKLSDSFLMECEDEKENYPSENQLSSEVEDIGYFSNTGTFSEDTTWSLCNMSASTPSKMKNK